MKTIPEIVEEFEASPMNVIKINRDGGEFIYVEVEDVRQKLTQTLQQQRTELLCVTDEEIDQRVATFELATDEQKKFIEMGMLDYRQMMQDRITHPNNPE